MPLTDTVNSKKQIVLRNFTRFFFFQPNATKPNYTNETPFLKKKKKKNSVLLLVIEIFLVCTFQRKLSFVLSCFLTLFFYCYFCKFIFYKIYFLFNPIYLSLIKVMLIVLLNAIVVTLIY